MSLTQKMSEKHEAFLAGLFRGRMSKGSGNQWHNPLDGRNPQTDYFAFGWDGKATLGKGVNVTRAMWRKCKEQTGGTVRPLLPLRFYNNESLDVDLDLVVLTAYDFAELLTDANLYHRILEENRQSLG